MERDCLSSVHPRVKFTREEEIDGKIAFLDVLINRHDDGSLSTQVCDFPFLQECTASSPRISGRRSIGAGASLHFRRGSGASLTSSAPSHRLRGVSKTIIMNFFSLLPPLFYIQSCPCFVYSHIFSIFIHGFPHLS